MYVCMQWLLRIRINCSRPAVPSSSECNDLVHSTRCEAVFGMNLTLVCPVCRNHSAIKWKHSNSSVQLSNYTSYNITLQGNSSVASGCYTCECTDGKRQRSCKFPTEVRPKGRYVPRTYVFIVYQYHQVIYGCFHTPMYELTCTVFTVSFFLPQQSSLT